MGDKGAAPIAAIDNGGVDRRALLTSAAAVLASTAVAGIARPAVAQRGPVRTLLKGGVVLSYDPAVGDFEQADVLIEDKRIVAVRPDISADAAVIDASRMIVLPGFIDTHHHFYQSALRNVLPNGVLADYFRDISGAATNHYRPRRRLYRQSDRCVALARCRHHHHHRPVAGLQYARAQRRPDQRA